MRKSCTDVTFFWPFNPLKAGLNPICHLLALLGAHHILRVSTVRVKGEAMYKEDFNENCYQVGRLWLIGFLKRAEVRICRINKNEENICEI